MNIDKKHADSTTITHLLYPLIVVLSALFSPIKKQFVSPYGVVSGKNTSILQNVITMDDLFER